MTWMNFDTSGVSRNGDAESDTRGISAEAGNFETRGFNREGANFDTSGVKTESGISGTRGAKTESGISGTSGAKTEDVNFETSGVSAGGESYTRGVTLPLSQLIPLVSPQSTPFFFSGRTPSGLNSHCGVRSAFSFPRTSFLFPCGGVV